MFNTYPTTRASRYHMRQAKRRNRMLPSQRRSLINGLMIWGLNFTLIIIGIVAVCADMGMFA